MNIHILGASGSGTTTLGIALASKLAVKHFDSDDFYWEKTDPPFTIKLPAEKRQLNLQHELDKYDSWILSGSMTGWGDSLIPKLDLVIYISLPKEERLSRLKAREKKQFGKRIEPGNDMYKNHVDFIEWAAAYDNGGLEMRSRSSHEEWLKRLNCPVIRIDGSMTIEEETEMVIREI